jgi:predicted nuclease of predicted toxin-antitoxin system
VKFLIDVNAAGALADFLLAAGHDIQLVSRVDCSMSDDDILRWAVREKRIIVTTDSDFDQMIWLQKREHFGVLRLENLPRLARMLLFEEVMANYAAALAEGAIVIATERKIRVRRM